MLFVFIAPCVGVAKRVSFVDLVRVMTTSLTHGCTCACAHGIIHLHQALLLATRARPDVFPIPCRSDIEEVLIGPGGLADSMDEDDQKHQDGGDDETEEGDGGGSAVQRSGINWASAADTFPRVVKVRRDTTNPFFAVSLNSCTHAVVPF